MSKIERQTNRYIIQRFLHASFGIHEACWQNYDYGRDISRDLMDKFRKEPNNAKLAEKVLTEITKARPYEKFRIGHECVTTTIEVGLEMGPRIQADAHLIERLLDGELPKGDRQESPLAHDGFRSFNGIIPGLAELNLDPYKMGAYCVSVVREAVRQKKTGKFQNKWIHLYKGPFKDDCFKVQNESACVNLGKKASIEAHKCFYTQEYTFCLTDYSKIGEQPTKTTYHSLAAAKAGGEPDKAELKKIADRNVNPVKIRG